MPEAAIRHYRLERYRLDTQTRELRDGDGPAIPLTTKAFDTLCYLIEHRQRVVGKDELLTSVWPGRVVEENNLTQAIAALRRAFGTNAGEHRYIVTVPGHGYRFVAEVQEGETDAATAPAQVAAAASAMPVVPPWRRAITFGAALFMLALFAVAAWRMREAPALTASRSDAQRTALAVLPFRSLSSGPRDEGLELGLADTLITRLSHSNALRVRSLASARRLSGPRSDPLAAGRQLGADYVVEGTTQRIGDQVRINARLLSVDKGAAVWADTFDARIEKVFNVQDAISNAVTSALALAPVVLPARGRSPCDGDDPVAYRALLRAQHQLQRRAPDTIAAFQQAITLDPVCARAYAGLTMAYLFMAHNDRDPAEVFPLARAAAAQALRIDPDSAEANMAQGRQLQLYAWDWARSEAALRRAVALNPSFADAHFSLAHLLVLTGRFDEGLEQARQARELDPLSPLINSLEGGFLSAAGQPRAARERLQRTLELEPDFWIALLVRGGLALDRGDTAAALADLNRSAERSQRTSQVLAVLAVADVAAGERAQAQAILRELDARDAVGYVPATSLAAVHNALGDTEAALDLLERAYREHDIRMAFLKVDARWNNLRSQPRFRALARRMGLEAEHATGRF
jgi:DNA-binding winged helix-turn-helix (wHTH) protein/TolB-like protein/Tfp pilus assembly protein PilF